MSAVLDINGNAATKITLHVPRVGVWYADVDFADDAPQLPTTAFGCSLRIDAAVFVGTVSTLRDGAFGLRRRTRIVGGANGWAQQVPARTYHNDAGVKAETVAREAAASVGEVIGAFSGGAVQLGNDYIRPEGVASRVLEDAARGAPWWVDYAGVTQVGARSGGTADADAYSVIDAHPRHGDIELAVDDITKIAIGAQLVAHLDSPRTVTSLEIAATPDSLRVYAWCGGGARSSLLDSLRAIVERLLDARLDGLYRYRVLQMNVDRVDLQRCGSRKDLPNTVSTPMWPGVSGAHAKLARGAEVLVAFIDGDRAQPAIVSFVGRGGPGDVPDRLDFGGVDAADVARKGDTVTAMLPPAVFAGTIVVGGVPSPATGAVIWSPPQIIGTISTGSSKVGVAT